MIERVRQHEIDAVVMVGGDGTMTTTRAHSCGAVCWWSVYPKTIDNDLSATDYTFGFDTALQTATCVAIDTLHTTAESHDRVMVVEVIWDECRSDCAVCRRCRWRERCRDPLDPEDDVERVIAKIKRRSEAR